MSSANRCWSKEANDGSLSICVDTAIYSLEVIFRTCYVFTDRCYLFLSPNESNSVINVFCACKTPGCDLAALVGEFSNELINQRVRMDIAAQTRTIRELIVAQAFAEADLLSESQVQADYIADPRGIAK
jgi:His-Xaa-Ser system protein HxsD